MITNYREILALILLGSIMLVPRIDGFFGFSPALILLPFFIEFKNFKKEDYVVFIAFVLAIIASITYGNSIEYPEIFKVDLKRGLQIIVIGGAALILKSMYFSEPSKRIFVILIYATSLILFISFISFIAFPNLYTKIVWMQNLPPESMVGNYHYGRFTFYFGDPNTSAFYLSFFALIVFKLLKTNALKFWIVGMIVIAIIFSQSRSGFLCLISVIILNINFLYIRKNIYKIIILFLLILFLIQYFHYFESLLARLSDGESFDGGRIFKYKSFFENFNFGIFGRGYTLFRGGIEFNPHSDLIRINLAYGCYALLFILYFFYSSDPSHGKYFILFLIPFITYSILDESSVAIFYLYTLSIIRSFGMRKIEK
jgi:hypothetical protein